MRGSASSLGEGLCLKPSPTEASRLHFGVFSHSCWSNSRRHVDEDPSRALSGLTPASIFSSPDCLLERGKSKGKMLVSPCRYSEDVQ